MKCKIENNVFYADATVDEGSVKTPLVYTRTGSFLISANVIEGILDNSLEPAVIQAPDESEGITCAIKE